MRFVNPARSPSEQNLVACQNGREVFFYTIRPVDPQRELLVWYSQEFTKRLCGHAEEQTDGLKPSEYILYSIYNIIGIPQGSQISISCILIVL